MGVLVYQHLVIAVMIGLSLCCRRIVLQKKVGGAPDGAQGHKVWWRHLVWEAPGYYVSKVVDLVEELSVKGIDGVPDSTLHSVRQSSYFSHSTTFTASGMAWVSKNPIFFLQINLFSFCARIEPKLSKLQKTVKIDKRSSKKPCFLIVF